MYFYTDESGNTGLNLFDESQPALYYGLLSCPWNLDEVAEPFLERFRQHFGVERLHAAELGVARLDTIGPAVGQVIERFGIKFDFYSINKVDYALIQFFDQVFDQGLNPTVGWFHYWTPLRYALLFKVAYLFDEALIKASWAARIERNDLKSDALLVTVCQELLNRVTSLPDQRSQQLVGDALRWAVANPRRLEYNANRKDMRRAISPNLIGFQFVLMGIASHLRETGRKVTSITVDLQQQFNKAQGSLATFYARGAGNIFPMGPGMPELDLRNMPTEALRFSSSHDSAGLELVDLCLWLVIKSQQRAGLSQALSDLVARLAQHALYDELSLQALHDRWAPVLLGMEEPTEEMMEAGAKLMAEAEHRRLAAVQALDP